MNLRSNTTDSGRKATARIPHDGRRNRVPFVRLVDANLLVRFRRDQSGSYLVIFAIMMPVLIGLVGLGVDYGVWMNASQKMQAAADPAAFSAAALLAGGP